MLEKALTRLKKVKNGQGIAEKHMRNPRKVIHFHIDAFEDKIELNKFKPKDKLDFDSINGMVNSTY
jgi:hypothetical protein